MAKGGLGCELILAEYFIYNDDGSTDAAQKAVDSLNKRSKRVEYGFRSVDRRHFG